ncbi:Cytochrome P450 2H2 [Chelonia mydas]|uniref:unspecific monooxygenase n=1 Tax=Chelonia mydas TaxID=8469 RepID=M7CAU5_CHEMY|nr:Cytochrome P450 2H2 [Chelonia mydas]
MSGSGKLPPGPVAFPIIGNALQLTTKNLPRSVHELSAKYGPIFTIYLGSERVVVLYGHEVVKEALVDQGDEFSERGRMPVFEKERVVVLYGHEVVKEALVAQGDEFSERGHMPVFEKGIPFNNGVPWKQLSQFTLTTLKNFGMGNKSTEQRILEEARFLVERLKNTHGRPFDPTLFLTHAVSNIICAIVFGDRFDYEDKKFVTLINLIEESNKLQRSPWTAEEQNSQSEFTTESLLRRTLGLFFAGTGTTSAILKHGLLLLMKYPEIEDEGFESTSPATPGTTIFPALQSVLYDSKAFPKPEQFNPGHFLDENGAFKKSDFFMPFSIGKQSCVGEGLTRMKLFLLLTTILQNFILKPLIDPKDIDITPMNFTSNTPVSYQFIVIPR